MIVLKFILIMFFVLCYILGGQGLKWARKWVGPAVFGTGTLALHALKGHDGILVIFGSLLYLAAANGFSYGDDWTHGETSLKILFRGLCGLSYGLCGLLIAIGAGHTLLWISHLLIAPAASIYFGIKNRFPDSWADDGVALGDGLIALSAVGLTILF